MSVKHRDAAVARAPVAHQIGGARLRLQRHRAGRRVMQVDAALDPGLPSPSIRTRPRAPRRRCRSRNAHAAHLVRRAGRKGREFLRCTRPAGRRGRRRRRRRPTARSHLPAAPTRGAPWVTSLHSTIQPPSRVRRDLISRMRPSASVTSSGRKSPLEAAPRRRATKARCRCVSASAAISPPAISSRTISP